MNDHAETKTATQTETTMRTTKIFERYNDDDSGSQRRVATKRDIRSHPVGSLE